MFDAPVLGGVRSGPLVAHQQRQFSPFPVAVDINETDLAQPPQLRLDIEKFVGRIFVLGSCAHFVNEPFMNRERRRRNVFEIAERTNWFQHGKDFAIQLLLAVIGAVMNGEA